MIIGQVLGKKRARPKGYNPAVSEMARQQESLELEKSLQVLTHTLRNAAPDVAGAASRGAAPPPPLPPSRRTRTPSWSSGSA